MNEEVDRRVAPLRATLAALAAGEIGPEVVCARFRMAAVQWPDLPPRYASVLERLLAPLDQAAMMGDESCSFSAAELGRSLSEWLDHASQIS